MRPLRSLLFVPGNRERFLTRLETLRPDGVILDLEDSIPATEKVAARTAVRKVLQTGRFPQHRLFVRVNDLRTSLTADDLAATVHPRVIGFILPKVSHSAELREANRLLAQAEALAGLEIGVSRLIPVVETVQGIVQVSEIATASPRVLGLNFGYDDFTLDLGVLRTREGLETLYPRARVALAARAAGLLAIDGPLADFGDLEGLDRECSVSRQLGFTGKQCIHPSQIEIVNRAFSPAREEVERARQIIAAYEDAAARGEGSTRLGGSAYMVDTPVVERARRLLAQYEAMRADESGEAAQAAP